MWLSYHTGDGSHSAKGQGDAKCGQVLVIFPQQNVPSLKLTYPLKMDGWKTSFLLGWPIFRCYVSFREGISLDLNIFGCVNFGCSNRERIQEMDRNMWQFAGLVMLTVVDDWSILMINRPSTQPIQQRMEGKKNILWRWAINTKD